MLARLPLAALALALSPRSDAGAQVERSLLAAIPEDAIFALAVDDVARLRSDLEESAWAAILRAPEFDPLWKSVEELQSDVVTEDLTAADMLAAVEGFAFYALDFEDETLGFLVRLDPDQERVDEVMRSDIEEGSELVSQDGRDVYVMENDEFCLAVARWEVGYALVQAPDRDSALVMLGELLEGVREDAQGDGLTAQLNGPSAPSPGTIHVYVDLQVLVSQVRSELEPDDLAVWSALALDECGWFGLQATFGAGVQCDVTSWIDLPERGLVPRLAACARPAPLELGRLAPADAIEVAVHGFDVAAAWREVRSAITASIPDSEPKLEAALEAAHAALGVDLVGDGIEMLTGEFATFLLPVEAPSSPDLEESTAAGVLALGNLLGAAPGRVTVIGLHETEPFEACVDALVEAAGVGEWIEDEQVGERWMTSLAVPELPLRPRWSYLDGALVVALYAEPVRLVLEQAADGAPAPWIEREGRRAALGAVDGACSASLADTQTWIQAELLEPLTWLAALAEE